MNKVYLGVFALILLAMPFVSISETPTNALSTETLTYFSDGTLRRIDVPILMYHYVGDLPEDADEYRVNLTISTERFHAHMEYLQNVDYNTISLYDLHNALNNGMPLPSRPIILTFDDGYANHFDNAFPLLQHYGFTGTFFVITDRSDNADPAHLSWEHIQQMAVSGMDIESHTKSHPDLRNRDFDFLIFQILGSIESIAAHIGEDTKMFSYPAGRYDETTLRVLQTMPIARAVTTQAGRLHTTDNYLEMTRLRISGDMSVAGLRQLLGG